jgi:SAM-dependent methyltransferase
MMRPSPASAEANKSSAGTRVGVCPACGSQDLKPYVSGHDFLYGNDGLFQFERCERCRLWVLSPMPDTDVLASYYPDGYYSFSKPGTEARSKVLVRTLLGLERRTYLPRSGSPGRLLDVGCGAGHYIYQLERRGWKTSGVEPSTAAVEAGRSAGLDIHPGNIRTAPFAPGSFDVVRFNHSFEHVPDPVPTLEAARALLKPEGYLFIGVPNTRGLWARMFAQHWWYCGLPVHTFAYDPANLKMLLERAGFQVEQVRYNAEYAGLLGSLQIWLNRNRQPRSALGPVLGSKLLRLPALWLCKLLDLVRLGDCIEVIARPAAGRR